jgi:pimeloyl-ACP methyl ester carboxylesterase
MGEREPFRVSVDGGELGGWTVGDGTPVLLLHGGPGLSYDYLDGIAAELGDGFRVASYQQRGLEPSTTTGPFTVAQAIADVVAVLDGLGWERALLVGHSWGGHLALRMVVAHGERLLGALAVDPLGIAGDGGMAAFAAEIAARVPRADRERAQLLDDRAMAGEGSPEDAVEGLRLFWPAYFADPGNAPPMPPIRMSLEAYSGLISEAVEGLEEVGAALAEAEVPIGVIAGAASPMPWGLAARATAELSPLAFLTVVPDAGHMPWLEHPGSVREALLRLPGAVAPTGG